MHAIQDHYADPIFDHAHSHEVIIDNRDNSDVHEDYQVSLAVDESHIFFEAQEGLRFVDENLQVADHWNESFPDVMWLEVPKVPASGICALRMLDASPSECLTSNGDSTFEFFDDFPGNELDLGRWFDNKYTSNPVISPEDGSANIDDVGTAWGYFMTNGTNDYRMYYTGIDSGADYDICLATSIDRKNSPPPRKQKNEADYDISN